MRGVSHSQWFRYFMTDVFRVAEYLGLPFKWPKPDPIVSRIGPNGRPDIAREQPYIRLTQWFHAVAIIARWP